jgi:hypothetical protein
MDEPMVAGRLRPRNEVTRSIQSDSQPLSLLSQIWLMVSPLLPLLFVVGWFLCRGFFDDDEQFLLTSLLAALATALLVFFLRRPVEGMFPIVILFAIFLVGYYFKFYWLVLTLDASGVQGAREFLDPMIQPFLYSENILRAFELSTWGFISFCAGAIACVWFGMAPRSLRAVELPGGRPKTLSKVRVLSVIYIVVALGIGLITSLLIYSLGIGVHGRLNVQLPYNLAGIIHYMNQLVVPSLLIFVMAWADHRGMRTYWWASFVGLIAYGVGVMLLTASRGALVVAVVIPVGTLWLVYRRLTRRRAFFLVILFLVVALLRPVFTGYRRLRVDRYANIGLTEMMVRAYQTAGSVGIADSSITYQWVLDRFMTIAVRVIGVDSVLYLAPLESVEIDISWIGSVLLGRQSLSRRFTQDIVGYGPTVVTHYSAPSLVGGLYFLGGVMGIAVGVFAVVLISQWIWVRLCRSRWWTAPLALTQAAGLAFSVGSEGTFESVLRDVFVTVAVIVGLEFVSRVKIGGRSC